ncbi:uncharacterized protein LOC134540591 [Bacillus rossius redtenbacheri]|uniref:uncharacterized protein LOC134540591 n=1 Tax=Bacillus rossius redtenbacheri TaxID=93214 RepID=UPI002FDE220E
MVGCGTLPFGSMPRFKSPKSLLKMSLKLVDDLIIRAAAAIQDLHGSYDNTECKACIEEFQQHLLSYIPSVVLEQVFNRCEQQRCCNSDNRIWFAIFMHRNMKEFKVLVSPRENKADDSFWIRNLSYLSNLVELNLRLVCTDEILEVVGGCCQKLTKIYIASKVEKDTTSTSLTFPFNAMKLNLFVSDEGLRHISRCKSLRVVTMSPLIRSHGGGRTMSVAGIRQLVRSLPCIQYVSYSDMGVVISEEMDDVDSLPLVRVDDSHPQARHIRAMSRLCPRLRSLVLTAAFNRTNTVDVMDALRGSDLEVSDLELVNFPACDSLLCLVRAKGVFLTRLCLKICNITFDLLSNIGQSCVNLQHLTLRENLRQSDTPLVDVPTRGRGGFRCMFVHLECLQVYGMQWNPLTLLPILLTHAKRLQSLSFLCHKDYGYLDRMFLQILEANPMPELLCVFIDCIMGSDGIRAICRCPKLRFFKYVVHVCFVLNCIAEIKKEFSNRNVDLKFVEIMAGERYPVELE